MEQRNYDLEDRLIKFAIAILNICDFLPRERSGSAIGNQLARCGTAPALLYGEAQAAESRADFIHKLKILLKELRESRICLRIIREKPIIYNQTTATAFKECNELIGIFSASIKTAKSKISK